MNEDLAQIEKEVAIIHEQMKQLIKISDEMRTDIREIKSTQDNRIQILEKQNAVLTERVERLDWLYKLVLGLAVSGFIGAILNLVIKT